MWFQSLSNTPNNECIAHQTSDHANCAGNVHDFVYTYDVKAAGTISSIWAEINTAPSGTAAWTVTVRKNGLTTAGNSLSCTITGPTATACEASGSVAIANGDFLSVQVTSTGSPGNKNWKSYVVIGS